MSSQTDSLVSLATETLSLKYANLCKCESLWTESLVSLATRDSKFKIRITVLVFEFSNRQFDKFGHPIL